MSLNRLLITSVVIENRTVRDVAAQYGVSQSWLFELLARYKAEGEAAFGTPLQATRVFLDRDRGRGRGPDRRAAGKAGRYRPGCRA